MGSSRTSHARAVLQLPLNMVCWMGQEPREEKLAVFLPRNSAEIGHGVPCCNARPTRVVRHKLAVDIDLVVSVTRCSPETESHFFGRKLAKTKKTLLNRHCALDFDWPGVIKEQTRYARTMHWTRPGALLSVAS